MRLFILVFLCIFGFLLPALAADSAPSAVENSGSIHITVIDEASNPIAGATLELKTRGITVRSVVSNAIGQADLSDLLPGSFEIVASMEGFETLTEKNVVLANGANLRIKVQMIVKPSVNESVTVSGESNPVDRGSSTVNELHPSQVKNLPNKPATVAEALPLVPGVVRKPDGGLSLSGSGEHRSAMVVNSIDVTDPATGQFGMTVPIDSVETLDVYKSPYLAEYGRFTGSVVAVETRSGGDKWNFELNDPLPEFRIRSLHLHGVRDFTPRFTMDGPLIPHRLYVAESMEFGLTYTPVHTLPFPENESKQELLNSFLQLDYLLSPTNTLTGSFHAAGTNYDYANLNFFNPRPVTPNKNSRDYIGAISDRLFIGSSMLESAIAFQSFNSNVDAQGAADMILTPTGNSGNYFSQQQRQDSRIELRESYSLAPISSGGTHNLKFGVAATHINNSGEFAANTVNIFDDSGNLLRRIDFVGGTPFNSSDLELEFYGQDHWSIDDKLALDLGMRFERQNIAQGFRVAPRFGLAWSPFDQNKTVIRGGVGIFYDRVPLSVYSFSHYPQQVITTYGPDGQVIDGPTQFENVIGRVNESKLPFLDNGDNPGNFAPYSAAWNAEIEHTFSDTFRIRANYLQNLSHGVIIVTPTTIDGQNAFVLNGNGSSVYRQLELMGRVTWHDQKNFLVFSYVHSFARGDVNGFENYLGDFPFPVVQDNQYAVASSDLPNRFLSWGEVKLPWRMRVRPLVEYRNGFPFSSYDSLQNYVSQANQFRFPHFFSLDARVSKDVPVNDKYTLRFSVTGVNLTNHFNPTEVHSNIADPQYGTFIGNLKRKFSLDFDVLF